MAADLSELKRLVSLALKASPLKDAPVLSFIPLLRKPKDLCPRARRGSQVNLQANDALLYCEKMDNLVVPNKRKQKEKNPNK